MAVLDPLNNDKDIFAKVTNGKITEFPVIRLYIKNRHHPIDWYTRCRFEPKPTITEFQYLKQSPRIEGDSVIVSYDVIDMTLREVLYKFKDKVASTMFNSVPVNISAVTPAQLAKTSELAAVHVQGLLDTFAQTKNYDDIKSVATYVNSSIPAFALDASTAVLLRDQSWDALNTYIASVQAGTTPVPLTVEEITAIIPTLAW